MRIAYVAGFFKHVLPDLQKALAGLLDSGAVLWIPPYGRTDELNINRLKGELLGAVNRGADEILVCLFYMRGKDYLLETVEAIADRGKSSSPLLEVRIKSFPSARDSAGVIAEILEFAPDASREPPLSLVTLEEWIGTNHPDRIILHPRASGAVKNSRYEDVPLVYEAINLLGTEYWDMRTCDSEESESCSASFAAKLQTLGLKYSKAVSDSMAGEQGAEYEVAYPQGTTKKRLLRYHLTKGVDRDERHCLRIYFFWDKESRKTVIGWLTSHLDTRAT